MSKRWVFTELVKDNRDHIGLIAYALYKVDKNELAESLRAQGFSSEIIDIKVKEYHDNIVEMSTTQHRYRENAERVMIELLTEMESKIFPDFQGQITKLQKQMEAKDKKHQKDLAKAKWAGVQSFYEAYCDSDKGKSKLLLSWFWLWNGFSGVLATIIVAILVYGAAALFVTSDKRDEILSSAADNIKSAVTSSSPIPEVKASPLPNNKS